MTNLIARAVSDLAIIASGNTTLGIASTRTRSDRHAIDHADLTVAYPPRRRTLGQQVQALRAAGATLITWS